MVWIYPGSAKEQLHDAQAADTARENGPVSAEDKRFRGGRVCLITLLIMWSHEPSVPLHGQQAMHQENAFDIIFGLEVLRSTYSLNA